MYLDNEFANIMPLLVLKEACIRLIGFLETRQPAPRGLRQARREPKEEVSDHEEEQYLQPVLPYRGSHTLSRQGSLKVNLNI
jgi:hypothetical protein